MPRTKLLAALGYAGLAVTDTVLAGRANTPVSTPTSRRARRLRFVTKPLLMPTLATSFTASTPHRTDVLRHSTLAGQLFSWGGDVALLGKSERLFLTGVGSFFAAHVAYITGFTSARGRGPGSALDTAGVKAAAGTWVVLAPTMAVMAGRKDPTMRVPIAAYATVLSAMFAASTTLDPGLPERARRKIVAGTALFLVSDSILGLQEFLLGARSPKLETAVMASYTAGQWLIADGVADAR